MSECERTVLTVSGTIPADLRELIEAGRRPRADYFELAAAMDAEVVDFTAARAELGALGRMLERIGGDDVALALACFRRRKHSRVILTDSERVGLIYAALTRLLRRRLLPGHVMIGHRLSPPKKVLMHRLLGLHRRVDRVIVYASTQANVAVSRLRYRPDQVVLTPFMVDTDFWRDGVGPPPDRRGRPMICAVGQELRDYRTLVEAVRGLDVDVVIAAASPWSKRKDTSDEVELPPNVEVVRLDQHELRRLYAGASFVVVPVVETDFQAGITTILEAMSMGRAVICSRTSGQTDTIRDGENGVYVAPADAAAMRTEIERLLADPSRAAALGRAGRSWVVADGDIEAYASRLAGVAADLQPRPGTRQW